MGCVSSNLLNQDDEFTHLGSSALSHHIVSLTSTTYGLLNLDPPPITTPNTATATTPPTPPLRFTLRSDPEVINSWELMSGLDTDSFRFCTKVKGSGTGAGADKENSNPNLTANDLKPIQKNLFGVVASNNNNKTSSVLDRFERLCPPDGENKVVIYTTSLRGIRRTFEDCNAVKSALENLGVAICERDVSMDRGFREELKELMKNKERELMVPPRVFVKGRYVGGAEEVLKFVEEGWFGDLFEEIPKRKAEGACQGCGDVRFLPCFQCNGSCKTVINVKEETGGRKLGTTLVVRCSQCNENGLVLCPICS
ncbi:hypothetical protein Ddye_002986 [Dipteronia dyeriana]|uniref:Glutaredoxin domain-containing protein n=1 Tax=Dipteronia dyeriana TaxID=168575 RepID=A0AAD9XSK8_9ROSI|nr:hypothetical protein Ddye_002986 [Dipteronia dyeriana]